MPRTKKRDLSIRAARHRERRRAEAVNHPAHYGGADNPYEAIKVIEAWGADFCIGNALKYMSRAGKKGGQSELTDLQKARWYLDRRIEQLNKASQ